MYLELGRRTDLFHALMARSGVMKVRLETGAGRSQLIALEYVSGNYFSGLGVTAAMGRVFDADNDRVPQGHPLAVLSYDCWRNRFGADPNILGRKLLIDER